MEILAIQKPPRQPIGAKTNIKVCPKCAAVLKFDYEDMYTKHKQGYELNFIKCPSCNTELTVSEVKRDEFSRAYDDTHQK